MKTFFYPCGCLCFARCLEFGLEGLVEWLEHLEDDWSADEGSSASFIGLSVFDSTDERASFNRLLLVGRWNIEYRMCTFLNTKPALLCWKGNLWHFRGRRGAHHLLETPTPPTQTNSPIWFLFYFQQQNSF